MVWDEVVEKGTTMFAGLYHHSLDEKARLTIPAKLLKAVKPEEQGMGFWITRGMEGCLFMYTPSRWHELVEKMPEGIETANGRKFQRLFFSRAELCYCDKQGRILIPEQLRNLVGIEKNCVILGVQDRIEIWPEQRWIEFEEENADNFETFAEDLFKKQSQS